MNQKISSTLLLGLVLLLSASLAFAQGVVTGSISGTVQDQQNAVIQGAKVTAREMGTNREFSAESDATGRYSLRALPVGNYNVTIEAANFNKVLVGGVVVSIAKETSLGAQILAVGSSGDVVNVESTPPLVEGTTTQISTTFTNRQVAELPIGTGFDSLALLVPGVAPAGDNAFGNTNGAAISSNGQRTRANNFMIDGQSNNDNSVSGPQFFMGNPDAVAEFQVITNYSAEFGRNMGSVVNLVTKNGTNNFHGTAFEFHQSSLFDSLKNEEKNPQQGFCAAGADPNGPDGLPNTGDECNVPGDPSLLIDNKFGGTIGGPVIKDKLWFFTGLYWQRTRTSGGVFNSTPQLTPTPAGIATLQAAYPGSASVAALAVLSPHNLPLGNPVAGGITNRTVSNGVTPTLVEFGTVTRFLSQPFNNFELVARGDWQVTSKDRFFARFLYQPTFFGNIVQFTTFAGGGFTDVPAKTYQIGTDWTHTFSPRFVNTARFSYGRADIGFENGAYAGCNRANVNNCPTLINLAGNNVDLGTGSTAPQGRLVNHSQWQDNASYIFGKHTLKFGGEYARQRSPSAFLPNQNGQFVYSNAVAGCPAGSTVASVECSFSRFLSNATTTFQLNQGAGVNNFKEQDFSFYLQDEWRVKDNLTLIMGVRYEFFQQAINLLHERTVAQQTGSSPFWDPSLPLDRTTIPHIPNDTNNWSPNIGFAWTPRIFPGLFGNGKTVVRGGFRISYDPSFYNIFLNTATAAPVVNLGTINTPVAIPAGTNFDGNEIRAALLSLIPTGVGIDPGVRTQTQVSSDFHNPYSQQWNLGIQRDLGGKMAFEVRYVGNHTVGNFQSVNANPALGGLINNGFGSLIPSGVTPCADATGGLGGGPMPGFLNGHVDCARRNVLRRQNTAFAIYHGLQTRFDISNWHNLTARVNYTWSKTIDNGSEIFSTLAGGNTLFYQQNPFDTNVGERATSGLDFPHVGSVALIYDLPFYRSQRGLLGKLLGGWQMNTTWRYASGGPYTAVQFKEGPFCDPTNTFNANFDTCRPILGNSSAALDSVGRCTDNLAADCGLVNEVTGAPTTFTDVHWIINDPTAALFLGSPFLGVGRNTERGDSVNTVNLGIFKNTKITERVTVQFQALAFNVMNRSFLGTPDPFVQDVGSSFGNTAFNVSGNFQTNAIEGGIAQRRLSFGLKLIF